MIAKHQNQNVLFHRQLEVPLGGVPHRVTLKEVLNALRVANEKFATVSTARHMAVTPPCDSGSDGGSLREDALRVKLALSNDLAGEMAERDDEVRPFTPGDGNAPSLVCRRQSEAEQPELQATRRHFIRFRHSRVTAHKETVWTAIFPNMAAVSEEITGRCSTPVLPSAPEKRLSLRQPAYFQVPGE